MNIKKMNRFQTGMHNNLRIAVAALQGLSENQRWILKIGLKKSFH